MEFDGFRECQSADCNRTGETLWDRQAALRDSPAAPLNLANFAI